MFLDVETEASVTWLIAVLTAFQLIVIDNGFDAVQFRKLVQANEKYKSQTQRSEKELFKAHSIGIELRCLNYEDLEANLVKEMAESVLKINARKMYQTQWDLRKMVDKLNFADVTSKYEHVFGLE